MFTLRQCPSIVRGYASVAKRLQKIAYKLQPPPPLLPWQENAIASFKEVVDNGEERKLLFNIQTQMEMTHILRELPQHIPRTDEKNTILVLSIAEKRMFEVFKMLETRYPDWKVVWEGPHGRPMAPANADLMLTTVRGFTKEECFKKLLNSRVQAIILDEAQHGAKSFWDRLSWRFSANDPFPWVIGLTSLHPKQLQAPMEMNAHFKSPFFRHDLLDECKEKWTPEVRFSTVPTHIGLTGLESWRSKFRTEELSPLMSAPGVISTIVNAWAERSASRKSTIVQCVDSSHSQALVDTFKEHQVDARVLGEQGENLEAFRSGEFPVLLVEDAQTVTNANHVDMVILANPVTAPTSFHRMYSMGTMASPESGKTDCHVVEIVDTARKQTGGLQWVPSPIAYTLHTWTRLDPDQQLTNASIDDIRDLIGGPSYATLPKPKTLLQRRRERAQKIQELQQDISVTESGERSPPDDLTPVSDDDITETDLQRDLRVLNSMKEVTWFHCGRFVYVSDLGERGYIVIAAINPNDNLLQRRYRAIHDPHPLDGGAILQIASKRADILLNLVNLTPEEGVSLTKVKSVAWNYITVAMKIRSTTLRSWQRMGLSSRQTTAIKRLWPVERIDNVRFRGEGIPRDEFLTWMSRLNGSSLLACLRSGIPDEEYAFLSEQTILQVANRMRKGSRKWDIVRTVRVLKRETKRRRKEMKKKRLKEKREAQRERASKAKK
ncbi:uncharacterized protein BT62DRAFT_994162 [Guyanagaster necrorhizus]|uniref:Uncharacterized protein n=1 Tax=Guyanagaster necrorhizus TaxID=856835 RepID=A0A9P7VSE6_9AGAR|nr:uncharacterized protein BT62DRAFT_994162 [Guyanagaster necrorhizus MCA 3950]KAG7446578.1 hypothetical protein BT62DRAFT_994162 [Guyanagaster necrorhizus MCA 3950]